MNITGGIESVNTHGGLADIKLASIRNPRPGGRIALTGRVTLYLPDVSLSPRVR